MPTDSVGDGRPDGFLRRGDLLAKGRGLRHRTPLGRGGAQKGGEDLAA